MAYVNRRHGMAGVLTPASVVQKSMAAGQRRSSQPWRDGEIAFLKSYESFSHAETRDLINSGYLHAGATCHPVIIVKGLSPTTFLITPVSAYSSGTENNFLPPWKQACHRRKNLSDFRSILGSAQANGNHAPLELEPGQTMPKPRASWLNVQSVWEVPISTLGYFTRAKTILRINKPSLDDLRAHIAAKCRSYDPSWQLTAPAPKVHRVEMKVRCSDNRVRSQPSGSSRKPPPSAGVQAAVQFSRTWSA